MFAQSVVQQLSRTPFLPRIVRAGSIFSVAKRASRLITSRVRVDIPDLGRIIVNPSHLLGSRVLFFVSWEPSITRYMKETLGRDGIAIDIGANISGHDSLIMSKVVGVAGKVYAIEPSPVMRKQLEENAALNDARNVVVVPYGISDRAERRSVLAPCVEPGREPLRRAVRRRARAAPPGGRDPGRRPGARVLHQDRCRRHGRSRALGPLSTTAALEPQPHDRGRAAYLPEPP